MKAKNLYYTKIIQQKTEKSNYGIIFADNRFCILQI